MCNRKERPGPPPGGGGGGGGAYHYWVRQHIGFIENTNIVVEVVIPARMDSEWSQKR